MKVEPTVSVKPKAETQSSFAKSASEDRRPNPILEELRPLIVGMCRHPNDATVEQDSEVLAITPHHEDYRIICGAQGKVIRALNVLARSAVSSQKLRGAHIQLEGPDDPPRGPAPQWPFEQDVEFNVPAALGKIRRVYELATGRACDMQHSRDVDQLTVKIKGGSLAEEYVVTAMDDVFYPWGFRNGMIIKIKPA